MSSESQYPGYEVQIRRPRFLDSDTEDSDTEDQDQSNASLIISTLQARFPSVVNIEDVVSVQVPIRARTKDIMGMDVVTRIGDIVHVELVMRTGDRIRVEVVMRATDQALGLGVRAEAEARAEAEPRAEANIRAANGTEALARTTSGGRRWWRSIREGWRMGQDREFE